MDQFFAIFSTSSPHLVPVCFKPHHTGSLSVSDSNNIRMLYKGICTMMERMEAGHDASEVLAGLPKVTGRSRARAS